MTELQEWEQYLKDVEIENRPIIVFNTKSADNTAKLLESQWKFYDEQMKRFDFVTQRVVNENQRLTKQYSSLPFFKRIFTKKPTLHSIPTRWVPMPSVHFPIQLPLVIARYDDFLERKPTKSKGGEVK